MTAPRKRAPVKRANKAAAAPKQSARERLLGRPRPSMPYPLLIDAAAVEKARADLARVQAETRQVLISANPGTVAAKRAGKRRADAEAEVEACYETLTLTALPPDELEALQGAHPPTAEQLAQVKTEREQAQKRGDELPDWPDYNEATYWPELLARTAADAGMSAQDWTTFLAENVSDGEKRGLKLAVIAVNQQERVADPLVLPKGWMQTRSSA